MFADGCIIFCRAIKTVARHVRNILNHYCKVSYQLANLHNSKIQFSRGTNNAHNMSLASMSFGFDTGCVS